jgi:hypothetical protein
MPVATMKNPAPRDKAKKTAVEGAARIAAEPPGAGKS